MSPRSDRRQRERVRGGQEQEVQLRGEEEVQSRVQASASLRITSPSWLAARSRPARSCLNFSGAEEALGDPEDELAEGVRWDVAELPSQSA